MNLGTVENIVLDDTNGEELYKVSVSYTNSGLGGSTECYPLDITCKRIPVIGEQVLVIPASRADAAANRKASLRSYYLCTVGIQSNINHNALPRLNVLTSVSPLGSSEKASVGATIQSPLSKPHKFGNGFVELKNLSQLQPYIGDVIFEGRFGQSIRFGYTPQNTKRSDNLVSGATIEPTWTSRKPEAPITIIRNGAGVSRGYNKFVVEDINKDESSIWLSSQQKIGLKASNKFNVSVTPVNQYTKPQLILNSDRLILNSKTDGVLLSGAKGVYISTPSWKADMDKMFTQIDELKKQVQEINNVLIKLGPALQTAITPLGGPIGSLVAVAPSIISSTAKVTGQLVKITTELQLMKN